MNELATTESLAIEKPPLLSPLDALLSDPARLAACPIETVERLYAVSRDDRKEWARQAFHAAMAHVQGELEPVARDADNRQTKSKYARLESISKAITPVYTARGFALSFGTSDCPTEGLVRVTCEATHSAGHSVPYRLDLPMDDSGIQGAVNKTPMHALASTLTYGRRYLTLMVFNLTMAGEDDDGNSGGGPMERVLHHQAAVREHFVSVACIKECLAVDELGQAAAAWFELDDDAKRMLWLAPTKGGIFTTAEHETIKSTAFREAHFGTATEET